MTTLPDSVEDSALARLFVGDDPASKVSWFSLPGGRTLYDKGEEADQLYFVRTGRLGAVRRDEGQEPQFLGVIRPGEPAGEMALIAGTPHSASVVALRDTEILALPRDAFFDAAEDDPLVMLELARLMIRRARQTSLRTATGDPSVYGFIGASEGTDVRALTERIAVEIEAMGYTVAVAGKESFNAPTEWFSNLESAHDFVLYAAETDEGPWKQVVGRQVDQLFRVGRGDRPPPAKIDVFASEPLQQHRLVDLILIQKPTCRAPAGSEPWLDAASPARLFHLRDGDRADEQRMARTLAGTSVGLVLSGGGARAYAHIGAVRALREAGVPIDFVGGASMGGIVAAAVALGWDDHEIDWRIRKAFVDTSPVDDIAFPILAMTHGEKVRARLREHFGDEQIADLWLPFFCVSTNLTSGGYQLHRRGTLRHALRASISLPGVLPPVIQGDNVLVDGAVMKNFPADIMRAFHLGPIVGVDVTRGRSITSADVQRPPSALRWFLSGEWRKGPPIVSILMRSATVDTGRDLIASREAVDVLVTPDLQRVEIRNWKAYDPAVEAGYKATVAKLATLTKPLTDLRRRTPQREAALLPQPRGLAAPRHHE